MFTSMSNLQNTLLTLTCAAVVGSLIPASGSVRTVCRPAAGTRTVSIDGAPVRQLPGKGRNTYAKEAPRRLGEQNPLVPPFCETFDNFRPGMEHDDFDRYFQVIDANKDGRSFGLYNYAQAEPYGRCAYLLYPYDVPQADDWLVPRAIKLEAGKYYCVSLDAALYVDGEPHTFEVKYGLFNDADGLDTTVIPSTSVSTTRFTHVEGWICPEFDTKYYLGIHATSNTQNGYLFIDNISVDAPREGSAPAGVTSVTLTNASDGSPEVDIAFTAPEKTLDGSGLTSISGITVKRGNTVVKTFDNVEPGHQYSVRDHAPAEGDYVYTITASNEAGAGATVRRDHYVGMVAPQPPVVTAFKDNGDGRMYLEWSAPSVDLNGTVIDPGIISYNVYDAVDGNPTLELKDMKSTSAFMDIPSTSGQRMIMKLVTATVNGRESDFAMSDMLVVGKPYELPFKCSFTTEDYNRYVFEVSGDEGVVWQMADDYSDPKAQDGDNGYIAMVGNASGQKSELTTGLINFKNSTAPAISFYTYVYSGDENVITVSVTDMNTGEKIEAGRVDLATVNRVGWNRIAFSLEKFSGKTVRISIGGHIITHGYVPVDNLIIDQLNNIDISVGDILYPRHAESGEKFEISAEIRNSGIDDVESCAVSLVRDGKEVASQTVSGLKRGECRVVKFNDMFSATSPMVSEYVVTADLADDGNPDDNTSPKFIISFIAPLHPAPTGLTVSEDGGGNMTLQWQSPDFSKIAPDEVSDDFESYDAFSTNFGGWSMIDVDKGYVGGFQNMEMPVDNTQQAWWVMPSSAPFSFITPHSGSQCLAQMYVINERGDNTVPCDDWLISPALYGGPQTIRFHVRSLSTEYGYDTFEVYYSDSGKTVECFKPLLPSTEASGQWEEYVVSLPDGARYFAVRCTSNNIYMLLLDDFTYIPEGSPRALEFLGYNVYRNGERINKNLVVQPTYSARIQDKTDRFFVTAVYDLGESVASNEVSLVAGAVNGIQPDYSVTPVEYFDMRGIKLSEDDLMPGIYIRRQGRNVSKIVIR